MKKFVIITLVVAMVAGTAFAQTNADGISINAWGRGVFSPLVVEGKYKAPGEDPTKVGGHGEVLGEYYLDPATGDIEKGDNTPASEGIDNRPIAHVGSGITWGGPMTRVDFRVNGNAEFIGFQAQLNAEGPSVGDSMHVWAKPFSNDLLKLTIGKFFVDDLRGKIDTDTGFENFIVGPYDGDPIFTRIKGGDNSEKWFGPASFLLSSQPIDGLFIGIKVDGALWNWGGEGSGSKAGDAYRFLTVAFGYNIADIGHFRAQYIGGWLGTITADKVKSLGEKGLAGPSNDPARIEAAFALTAIENLLVDIGFKFWMPINYDQAYKTAKGVDVGIGARYRMEAFQVVGEIVSNFAGHAYRGWTDDKQTDGFSLGVNLIPTYDLEAFTIGASLGARWATSGRSPKGKRYGDDGWGSETWSQYGFGGFAEKNLGNGSVKAGLAYHTAPIVSTKNTDRGKEADFSGASGRGVFSIPIIVTYGFW